MIDTRLAPSFDVVDMQSVRPLIFDTLFDTSLVSRYTLLSRFVYLSPAMEGTCCSLPSSPNV